MEVICKQMRFPPVTAKFQRVRTLTHRQLEMELDTKNHRGRDGRRQTHKTAIHCSLSILEKFLGKYATPYFEKLLISGNKKVIDFTKYAHEP